MRRPCVFLGLAMAASLAVGVLFSLTGAALFLPAGVFAAGGIVCFGLRERKRVLSALALICAGAALAFCCLGVSDALHRVPAERVAGETDRFAVRVLSYGAENAGGSYDYTVRIRKKGEDKFILKATLRLTEGDYAPGDLVRVTARATRPSGEGRPNYDLNYRARNVWLCLWAEGGGELAERRRGPLEWPAMLANDVRRRLAGLFPPEEGGILTGVMESGKDCLTAEMSEAARRTGVSHIFAVSGMHLAILAGAILLLFRSRKAVFVLIPVCAFFAMMTGMSPSVLRAALMLILCQLAPWFRRENDGVNTLFFVLCVLLCVNPWQICSLSLLYSFGAMLGLLLFSARLEAFFDRPARRMPRALRPVWHFLSAGTSAYLCANVFTLPITVVAFAQIPLLGLLVNLAVVWCLPILLLGGYLLYLLAVALPGAAPVAAKILLPLLSYVRVIILRLGDAEGAVVSLRGPVFIAFFIFAYAGLIATLLCKPHRPTLFWAVTTGVGLCAALIISASLTASSVMVTWLSVGSGQCVCLRSGDEAVILDCGGSHAAEAAEDWLAGENLSRADCLILSHTDSDHSNGVPALCADRKIGELVLTEYATGEAAGQKLMAAARDAGIPVTVLRQDTVRRLNGSTLTLLAPVEGSEQMCIMTLLSVGSTDVFFSGDMTFADENWLIRRDALPDLEVLTVAHHGSKYGTSTAFLEAFDPEYAVISVGKNSYGHPAPETLKRLEEQDIVTLTTKEEGDVTLRITGKGYRFAA